MDGARYILKRIANGGLRLEAGGRGKRPDACSPVRGGWSVATGASPWNRGRPPPLVSSPARGDCNQAPLTGLEKKTTAPTPGSRAFCIHRCSAGVYPPRSWGLWGHVARGVNPRATRHAPMAGCDSRCTTLSRPGLQINPAYGGETPAPPMVTLATKHSHTSHHRGITFTPPATGRIILRQAAREFRGTGYGIRLTGVKYPVPRTIWNDMRSCTISRFICWLPDGRFPQASFPVKRPAYQWEHGGGRSGTECLPECRRQRRSS